MFLGIVDQASCIPVGSSDLLVFLNLIPQLVAQVALDLLKFRQFQDALQQEKVSQVGDQNTTHTEKTYLDLQWTPVSLDWNRQKQDYR